MFARFLRLIKSWVGYFIAFGENPEVMLQQSIQEMRETMPRLNQILVQTRAVVIQLEEDVARNSSEEKRLLADIKSLLQDGSPAARQVAEEKAMRLAAVRSDLASAKEKQDTAQKAYDNAVVQVEEMKRRLKEKMEEAQRAVQESRRADTLKKASDALAQLETYGVGATNEEFLGKVRQKSAEAKAAVEIATGGTQIEQAKAERAARQAQAKSLLSELEVEMGLKAPTPESVAQPSSIGPREKTRG
ncbi:MAG TPA: PspA/IM30 family protein [Thermoanaerobaculia bacterium]|nr:PspA/IM30 family protein [Thermoanaerobaculia bacterium]